ncbi:hypothetical protein E2C01_063517 [Portunus trituberculatus]|uniref:Uncharacterized protein n=1 Tax=Portunus trituberculatus TaxID=210409 RepID=A0A5B7HKP6_PORTR|nr:hypothetical protein [Portunus trituberculatus]
MDEVERWMVVDERIGVKDEGFEMVEEVAGWCHHSTASNTLPALSFTHCKAQQGTSTPTARTVTLRPLSLTRLTSSTSRCQLSGDSWPRPHLIAEAELTCTGRDLVTSPDTPISLGPSPQALPHVKENVKGLGKTFEH